MDILETLAERGAILMDYHFVYKSGTHGLHYINMDPVFPDTRLVKEVGRSLGAPFREAGIQVVVAAATGGIPLAYATALGLDEQHNGLHTYPAVAWADKVGDDFTFQRAGFVEQLKGKRVLVVEDLLNTGDTVKKVIEQVRKHGGIVIGVIAVCNRGSETAESLGVPCLEALAEVDFHVLDADTCSLCAEAVPIVSDIGHGGSYQEQHPDYAGGYVALLSG